MHDFRKIAGVYISFKTSKSVIPRVGVVQLFSEVAEPWKNYRLISFKTEEPSKCHLGKLRSQAFFKGCIDYRNRVIFHSQFVKFNWVILYIFLDIFVLLQVIYVTLKDKEKCTSSPSSSLAIITNFMCLHTP